MRNIKREEITWDTEGEFIPYIEYDRIVKYELGLTFDDFKDHLLDYGMYDVMGNFTKSDYENYIYLYWKEGYPLKEEEDIDNFIEWVTKNWR